MQAEPKVNPNRNGCEPLNGAETKPNFAHGSGPQVYKSPSKQKNKKHEAAPKQPPHETATEEQIQAIRAWSVADCYSAVERAVLAYTDCLVLEGGRVPDAIFDALHEHLDDTEILEFTYITCTYAMHATMSRALRLEYDDVDDPMVEVAAPEGASTDVMAAVDATR